VTRSRTSRRLERKVRACGVPATEAAWVLRQARRTGKYLAERPLVRKAVRP
jgi:hypothetical protein